MSRSGDDGQGIEHAVGAALHAQLPKVLEQAFRSELVAPLVDRINSLESLLIEHLQHGRGGHCPSCQRCRTEESHERHAKGAWAPPVAESNTRCRSQDTKAEHWVSECGPICEGLENGDSWQQADADGDIVPAGSGSCGAEPGAGPDEEAEVRQRRQWRPRQSLVSEAIRCFDAGALQSHTPCMITRQLSIATTCR